jgi:hypothetical protein
MLDHVNTMSRTITKVYTTAVQAPRPFICACDVRSCSLERRLKSVQVFVSVADTAVDSDVFAIANAFGELVDHLSHLV